MRLLPELSPQLFDFPNLHAERMEISTFISGLTPCIPEIDALPDWTIRFLLNLGKGGAAGIYKKSITSPSNPPEKRYSIFLPMPSSDEIGWGANKKKYAYRPPIDMNRFYPLDVDYRQFNSMSAYIVEGAKTAILAILERGVKIKGIKLPLITS